MIPVEIPWLSKQEKLKPTDSEYGLLFGDDLYKPELPIRAVEFQLVDENDASLEFHPFFTHIATSAGGRGYFSHYQILGKFACFNDDRGRSYYLNFVVTDPQPTELKVRLFGPGEPDCRVTLTNVHGEELAAGVASGNDWNPFEIG